MGKHFTLWSNMESEDDDADIGILGVPFDNAVSWRSGARFAPERMRAVTPQKAAITEEGTPLALRVKDYGDVAYDLNWERFFASTEEAAYRVLQGQHRLPVFLGGDHSVTIPLFKAFSRRFPQSVGYIQFDAHPDLINEFEGSRWSHACTVRRHLEQPHLLHKHIAFVGLRSYVKEELAYYAANPDIGWHTARDIYRLGIESIAHDVVTQLKDVDAIYLSLDIDGLDPSSAPGTGTPEHGGPTMRQCLEFLRIIFANLPVKAMDIVEVSPPLDPSEVTTLAALKIVYEVFGFVQCR